MGPGFEAPIDDGAILVRADGREPVYLIDGGMKRWIVNPAAFDRYRFSWDRVVVVPGILLDAIPTGPEIR